MTMTLIDVSHHQGAINWDALAGRIDGAIISCGYGSDYANQDDRQYHRNVSECKRLGIPFGVYLYSYASSDSMASSEADHLLRLLPSPSEMGFPVYLDVEEGGLEWFYRRACEVVGPRIEAAGYWFGWYTGRYNANSLDMRVLPYTAWVAEYGAALSYNGTADIWQYTSTAYIGGIGPLDANECYRDFPAEIHGGSYEPPEPSPEPEPSASFSVGDVVTVVNPVDENGTSLNVSGTYEVIEVSGNRVVIGRGGVVTAAMPASHLSKVGGGASPTISVGSLVKVVTPVDENGTPLAVNGTYVVMELDGRRAVIGRDGQVTAAIDIGNIALTNGGVGAEMTGGGTYTVQEGDNLSAIAANNGWGSNYMGLAAKNGIADPNVIYPGQVLYL
jgi:LysM repeat protein